MTSTLDDQRERVTDQRSLVTSGITLEVEPLRKPLIFPAPIPTAALLSFDSMLFLPSLFFANATTCRVTVLTSRLAYYQIVRLMLFTCLVVRFAGCQHRNPGVLRDNLPFLGLLFFSSSLEISYPGSHALDYLRYSSARLAFGGVADKEEMTFSSPIPSRPSPGVEKSVLSCLVHGSPKSQQQNTLFRFLHSPDSAVVPQRNDLGSLGL